MNLISLNFDFNFFSKFEKNCFPDDIFIYFSKNLLNKNQKIEKKRKKLFLYHLISPDMADDLVA